MGWKFWGRPRAQEKPEIKATFQGHQMEIVQAYLNQALPPYATVHIWSKDMDSFLVDFFTGGSMEGKASISFELEGRDKVHVRYNGQGKVEELQLGDSYIGRIFLRIDIGEDGKLKLPDKSIHVELHSGLERTITPQEAEQLVTEALNKANSFIADLEALREDPLVKAKLEEMKAQLSPKPQ